MTHPELLPNSGIKYDFSISFYNKKKLTFSELLPNTKDFSKDDVRYKYFFLSYVNLFKSLVTGISAKSTFRKVFDFKKLKII